MLPLITLSCGGTCSLVEGGVYLVTHLEPVEKPSNKWGLMELRPGKFTA